MKCLYFFKIKTIRFLFIVVVTIRRTLDSIYVILIKFGLKYEILFQNRNAGFKKKKNYRFSIFLSKIRKYLSFQKQKKHLKVLPLSVSKLLQFPVKTFI